MSIPAGSDYSARRVLFMSRGLTPQLASFRYRMAIPAAELRKLGREIRFASEPKPADVVLFMKHGIPGESDIAARMKKAGTKVVFDICDDHFAKPDLGSHYRRMARLADVVTVPTEEMERVVRKETGVSDIRVIPDPYEQEELQPHAVGEKLLWFGHQLNLLELTPLLERLTDWSLRVVTGGDIPGTVAWSPESMKASLREANVVLIPSRKKAASTNRMVESIRSGCFVVSSDVPVSYRQFSQWMYVGDVLKGLDWVKSHQDELNDRVREAQKYVAEHFSPQVVAQKWDKAL